LASILKKILTETRDEISRCKKKVSVKDFNAFEEYHRPRRDFRGSLLRDGSVSVIAEVKKASPSKGIIRNDYNPVLLAHDYQNYGASAISVLTDTPFFKGALSHLQEVSAISRIPVLRKDFIVDFYQIEEARAWGADAILLIAKITDGQQLTELHAAAEETGLQVLVECYDEVDFARLDFSFVSIAGVNNRNLDTFEVDLHRGVELLSRTPDDVLRVSESGLTKPEDLLFLKENNIHSALIGEHFMRQDEPGKEVQRIRELVTMNS